MFYKLPIEHHFRLNYYCDSFIINTIPMKSITIIGCTLILGFSFISESLEKFKTFSNPGCQSIHKIETIPFFLNITSQGQNTVTKEKIHNTEKISDLIPDFQIQESVKNNSFTLKDVQIKIENKNIDGIKQNTEKRDGNTLSKDQKELLKSTDYSTTFYLEGVLSKDIENSEKERHFNYFITVVPEKQATYKAGQMALIDYLKTSCQPMISTIEKGTFQAGNIHFTVSKSGSVSNINLYSTSGYPAIDMKMMELMKNLPNVWNVASNGNGEKVDQDLVLSFGNMGC